jgi:hypothetical protein
VEECAAMIGNYHLLASQAIATLLMTSGAADEFESTAAQESTLGDS